MTEGPIENHDELAELDANIIEHGADWVATYKNFWDISKNPVFAWGAIRLLLDPRTPARALPAWLHDYVYECADNIMELILEAPPKTIPKLLGHALGLTAPTRNIIKDAGELKDASFLFGLYNYLFEHAPVKQGAAIWACGEIRQHFNMQSNESVRQRIIEAKKVVRALLLSSGRPADDAAIKEACFTDFMIKIKASKILKSHQAPTPTPGEMRAYFGSPPTTGQALKKVLKKGAPYPAGESERAT